MMQVATLETELDKSRAVLAVAREQHAAALDAAAAKRQQAVADATNDARAAAAEARLGGSLISMFCFGSRPPATLRCVSQTETAA